ncbi:MAG TPA: hypothetical protein DCQ06_07975 [Myxococcales bacterium]|nr:hypothetical protein [Myxococcales bacterium]
MLLRKKKRVPLPMAQDTVDTMLERSRQGEVAHLPESIIRGEQVARSISDAVASLPADNRAMFVAIDVHGEDKVTVADRHGLSVSALKARLHRVRKTIRRAAEAEPRAMVA